MQQYIDIIINAYNGYANHLWKEITQPHWHNYFYWLLLVSAFFFVLEIIKPWRKEQAIFRKDFWLDFFYMFFNFFLFWLIIYNAASDVVVHLFNDIILSLTSFDLQASNPLRNLDMWAILLIGFVIRDFVQWWVHRLLHKSDTLWEFHKVHHSVEQMGFAAHLRYHWMETVVYRSLEYIPLALLGIGLYDFFIIHIFTLAVGHYNHSNISIDSRITGAILAGLIAIPIATSSFDIEILSGILLWQQLLFIVASAILGSLIFAPFMKKVFNSPEMHIWHHSYELPDDRKYGINFGLTLAIWDYIFGTAYIPHSGQNIRLGFPDIEKFPQGFIEQNMQGFIEKK